jgi:hypothetical protein
MNKLIVGFSTVAYIGSLVFLWNTNHGVIAFITALAAGVFLLTSFLLAWDNHTSSAGVSVIAAAIALGISYNTAESDREKLAQKEAELSAKAEAENAEKIRRAALTPSQRAAEDRKRMIEKDRVVYGQLLTRSIKENAFDPKALQLRSPRYYNNGVCVEANGKNRFGAYVGWQKHCYLIDNKGKWKYSGPA